MARLHDMPAWDCCSFGLSWQNAGHELLLPASQTRTQEGCLRLMRNGVLHLPAQKGHVQSDACR